MIIDPANNPFCRPAPAHYAGMDWLCTVTAEDRIRLVREMDAPTLQRALQVPDLQATVRRAAESRLRVLSKGQPK